MQILGEIMNKILSMWIYLYLLSLKQWGSDQLNIQPIQKYVELSFS